jgi:large subunit ribosomal protein L22
MEAIAKAKYQKGSPRKARLVIDLIRGKNVAHALAILKFTNKRATGPIAKCLNSAIANATYKAERKNIAIDPDDLWIKSCKVDIGPTKNRRRLRPAPQGRAYFERRHFCHITIEVTSDEREVKEEEKTFEKRGKKVMAKQAGGSAQTDKQEKKADEAVVENEEVTEETVETPAAAEETTAGEAETSEEVSAESAEEAPEEKTEETEETGEAEESAAEPDAAADEQKDAGAAVNPETSEDPIGEETPENKPLAAQTDEEKTGTDKAADRQVDDNEELERQ